MQISKLFLDFKGNKEKEKKLPLDEIQDTTSREKEKSSEPEKVPKKKLYINYRKKYGKYFQPKQWRAQKKFYKKVQYFLKMDGKASFQSKSRPYLETTTENEIG